MAVPGQSKESGETSSEAEARLRWDERTGFTGRRSEREAGGLEKWRAQVCGHPCHFPVVAITKYHKLAA